MTARPRVFFAIWPGAAVRTALAAAAVEAQAHCGGRAIPADKIHLTLFFVGAVERARLPAIEAIGAAIHGRAFDLELDRTGYFRRAGIVWAGTNATPEALLELVESLRDALAAHGIRGEDRPYVPHLTLVRDAARAPASAALAPHTVHARELALVESVPVASGVRYDNVAVWPLR